MNLITLNYKNQLTIISIWTWEAFAFVFQMFSKNFYFYNFLVVYMDDFDVILTYFQKEIYLNVYKINNYQWKFLIKKKMTWIFNINKVFSTFNKIYPPLHNFLHVIYYRLLKANPHINCKLHKDLSEITFDVS